MLSTFVKVGRISNLSDARYCAGMMVDALGFCMDPQAGDYVSNKTFNEISQWISGPEFIGEAGALNLEELLAFSDTYGFQTLEIDRVELVEPLKEAGYSLIFRYSVKKESDLTDFLRLKESVAASVIYFIIAFEEDSLFSFADLSDLGDCLISVQDVLGTLEKLKSGPFKGIELVGTPEEKPGLKDYGNVMDVLEALED